MKVSLKWILVISYLTITLIALVVISISLYFFSEKVFSNLSYSITENLSKSISDKFNELSHKANNTLYLTQKLYNNGIIGANDESLTKYFYGQLSTNQDNIGIYCGRPNGDFIYVSRFRNGKLGVFRTKIIKHANKKKKTYLSWHDKDFNVILDKVINNDGYDPRNRPWYEASKNTRLISWTAPYIFYTSKKAGITASKSIYGNNNKLEGIIGVDIELSDLSAFLSNFDIGKNGTAFIVDNNNNIIAHSDFDKYTYLREEKKHQNYLLKIDGIDDDLMKFSLKLLLEKNRVNSIFDIKDISPLRFKYNKKYYILKITPLGNEMLSWANIIYFPENDYLGLIKGSRKFILFIILFFSLLITIITFLISHIISSPINKLNKDLQFVSNQQFEAPLRISSFVLEIENLVKSFNMMKLSLKIYQTKNEGLQKEIKDSHLETIFRLAAVAEYKDKDTSRHLRRISHYAVIIAENLNLSKVDIDLVRYASPMHDIGKMGIPDAILNKPGFLSDEERAEIEKHTSIGKKILRHPNSILMKVSGEITQFHHEKWDGTGYPKQLKGEDIPLLARIVSVADVFDALVSKRSYKEAIPFDEAIRILEKGKGRWFDPACVTAFTQGIDKIEKVYNKYKSL